MQQKSKTTVFFGTEDFSATALKRLLEKHTVDLVITKPDAIKGRGRKIQMPLVKEIALEHNLTVLQPRDINEAVSHIQKLENPLGVLVSYGKIIPQNILDLFPNGIVNIHPSLLPKYRGPSPIESTIANGDSLAGVSLMYLVLRMDAGPIISQYSMSTDGTETQESLYKKLAEEGSNLLLEFMDKYTSNADIESKPQNEGDATYTKLLSKDMTHVSPDSMTAQEIERKIRAHHIYPKTSLNVLGDQRIVTQAHVTTSAEEGAISCKNETWLMVDKLISKSGKTITLRDLVNSLNNK